MKLFELRACWDEYYDDPESGPVDVGERYDTIAISIETDSRLREIKTELEKGFPDGYSTQRICALRKLYPGYEWFREIKYKIIELTDLVV